MPQALVNMMLDRSRDMRDTVAKVADIPNVDWASLFYGPTDATAYVNAQNDQAFSDTIFKINSTPGVAGTDTRIMVR